MTNLEANSTGLQEILAMVNALPESGSGGGSGSSTITLTFGYYSMTTGMARHNPLVSYYVSESPDGSFSAESYSPITGGGTPNNVVRSILVKTGQIIVLSLYNAGSTSLTVSGGVSLLGTKDQLAVFSVASDGSITAIRN